MKGSPRSLMLTWANTVAGWWTSTAVSAMQRQQRAMVTATLNAMKPTPVRKRRRKGKR
jgi:hypothetical protein